MRREAEQQRLFTRRAVILGGGQLLAMSSLAARMYYLQIVEGERYKTLADENRISLRLLAPPRGRIVDRFGEPLATNQQNYRALLVPENTPAIELTLKRLAKIIDLSDRDRQRILREVKRRRRFVPVVVQENLHWRAVAQIEVNTLALPGVLIDVGDSRYYPGGKATAPVLGYVAPVAEKDRSGDPLLELPGFRIGRAGLEKVHDLALRGRGGTSQVEVNAVGRTIRELSRIEGSPGVEARLTIDGDLQRFVAERLGDESASVVVMDVHTGEVLGMASTPSYDPNAFNRGLSASEWRALVNNPRAPLSNKAIAGQYAPGSTFKMTVALAALEKGVINPRSQFRCPGSMELGNATFHCWKKTGHGTMDLVNAITQSCDLYFYEVARRTGIDRITAVARRLGFGTRLGIDLPGEQPGLTPTRAWKKKAKGEVWHQGETLLAGIGQGFILATPLQLAVMIARLVNGGRAVTPRLTRHIVQYPSEAAPLVLPEYSDIGLHRTHLDIIRRAMARVSNSAYGTAYRARIKEPGFEMGGKTGTVQVRRISKYEREYGVKKNADLEWHERDHALFVGYAPLKSPRYAVSVVVEHGGGGASVAAPIARDILFEVQRRDPSGGLVTGRPGTVEAGQET